MKLKDIIREELADHISISANDIRDAIRATLKNMDIEYLVADAITCQIKDIVEETVTDEIEELVGEVIEYKFN